MQGQRFYIKTLGCKVNQYESQVIRENFLRCGYKEASSIDGSDICVVNTCTVTSVSDSKSLRIIRSAVKKDKDVAVTGCMLEDKELDLSRLAGARFIVRNRDKYRIPEIVEGQGTRDKGQGSKISGLRDHTRVFVKVQDGCDNACSYCKVRIVRGRSRSRLSNEVIEECRGLIEGGTKEIVLAGICLGAYGRDLYNGLSLSRLIEEVCKIDGNWRLRLSSIEPKDITNDLMRQIQLQKRLCKHVHIPFQSGDDYILKKMNRPYRAIEYKDSVRRVRQSIPDIAISTDIMVGFPGETEGRFQNTVGFLKDSKPMRMHIFPFSRRRGTLADSYSDNVTGAVKAQREKALHSLSMELASEYVGRFAGRNIEVLVESRRSKEGYLQGYTDRYIKVYIEGPDSLKGHLINIPLTMPLCHAQPSPVP